MIVDIINQVLTKIKIAMPNVEVLSPLQKVSPRFPAIVVDEMENSANTMTRDSGGFKHSNIGIRIEIYTVGDTRLSESRRIRKDIDTILSDELGLTRGTVVNVPNYMDDNIYRAVVDYTGVIDNKQTIYGR